MIKEYDEKTEGIIKSGQYLVIPELIVGDDLVFKASCIATAGISCSGKVSAFFDLVVFGDVRAQEIEVKGRFVCTGVCEAENNLIVQNDIWAEEISADYIETHDKVVAQEIDAKTLSAEGSILIGKTLAIEEMASSNRSILCGETAYGAGRVSANVIITGEPLDLDDGMDAVSSPNVYYHAENNGKKHEEIETLSKKFEEKNDFKGYIFALIERTFDQKRIDRLNKYVQVLSVIEAQSSEIYTKCRDTALLLWMSDIISSGLFTDWEKIKQWYKCLLDSFTRLSRNEPPTGNETTVCKTEKLRVGDTLIHRSYGTGTVEVIEKTFDGKIVSVRYAKDRQIRMHRFPISEAYFRMVGMPNESSISNRYRESITCEPESYEDWLMLSLFLHEYGKDYAPEFSLIIFALLSSNFGLKTKFVTDRFAEKGWKLYAE